MFIRVGGYMNILDYFRGTPRPVQKQILESVQAYWNQYDVFVVNAPVASGKSRVAACIADWVGSARITTPTNILVDQYKQDFEDLAYVKSSYNYDCEHFGRCANSKKNYCKGCPYLADYHKAKVAPKTVSTTHMLLALRSQKKVNIFDEAHNLPRIVADLSSKTLWPHKLGLALNGLNDYKYLEDWAKALKHKSKDADFIHTNLNSTYPEFIFEFGQEYYSGGGYVYDLKVKKGQPTLIPAIKALPIDIRGTSTFWKNQKLVLMSATIGRKDIEALGLDKRRVLYIEGKSPINKDRRPVFKNYVGSLNHNNVDSLIDPLVIKIKELKNKYKNKGIVHTTYALAAKLRARLGEDGFIYHSPLTTSEALNTFKKSKNSVFIASGLYEGVSLNEDLSRWQAVAKIPWPSLQNKGIMFKTNQDPEYYAWETIKPLLQASGRIVRTPEDYGDTHILDASYDRLKEYEYLMPTWFKESVI
jgi:Rad3-related DNA helicase